MAGCAEGAVGLGLLRRREVPRFSLSTFLMIAAHAALYVFYSLYLAQMGYSNTVIGLMWSLGVIAEIVFFFYQAPIFRRFGVRNLMMASLLLAVVRFLIIGSAPDRSCGCCSRNYCMRRPSGCIIRRR